MWGKGAAGVTLGLVCSLALSGPAAAADFYVDRDAGATNSNCLAAAPCKTVAEALDLADNDAVADTVHVGRSTGAYTPGVIVPDTPVTLLGGEYNFTGTGSASMIDGGSAPAMTVGGNSTQLVEGLTLQGGMTAPGAGSTLVGFGQHLTIEGNSFNETDPIGTYVDLTGSPRVIGNSIVGFDDATHWANGIGMNTAVAPVIVGNSVSGIERPIVVFGDTNQLTIAGNTLQPFGNDAPSGGGTPGAMGIQLGNGAGGDITDNLVIPGPGLDSAAAGIFFSGDGHGSRRLARNRIFAFPAYGIRVQTADPVALNGDVIADNDGPGVYLQTVGSDVTVTNATIWHNSNAGTIGDILIGDTATLNIDSAIIGNHGVGAAAGTPACTAVFSRGPAVNGACNGQFATTATPSFVDSSPTVRDFHLTPSGNPSLIDTGNPAAPAFPVDLDGEPRALDGIANGICAPRRDIGADELPGLSGSDCLPQPQAPSTTRRCPKGKKLVTIKKHGKKKKKVCRKKKRGKKKRR